MTLSIRDPETDRLARELAALTGETMTEAIKQAVKERVERVRGVKERVERAERKQDAMVAERIRRIDEIVERIKQLPVFDDRSADEILGYDENGLPT